MFVSQSRFFAKANNRTAQVAQRAFASRRFASERASRLCCVRPCAHNMGLPRYGFFETSTAAAYLGPGPGKRTSARLAYGPGPGGSFDVFCAAGLIYDLPPLHVYKERSSSFKIPPCRTSPPPYKPPVFKPPPVWADRLCMTPGQAAQFRKDGAMKSSGMFGPSVGMPLPLRSMCSITTASASVFDSLTEK